MPRNRGRIGELGTRKGLRHMRTVIVLMMWATTALAQQAERTSPQLATEQLLQEMQAQITALKADETCSQVKMVELLKTYRDSHPNVVALRRKLDQLRAQEDAVRRSYALTSLKQISTGLQPGLPDRWWKNPATAQS